MLKSGASLKCHRVHGVAAAVGKASEGVTEVEKERGLVCLLTAHTWTDTLILLLALETACNFSSTWLLSPFNGRK